jgi:hypothetical protein
MHVTYLLGCMTTVTLSATMATIEYNDSICQKSIKGAKILKDERSTNCMPRPRASEHINCRVRERCMVLRNSCKIFNFRKLG